MPLVISFEIPDTRIKKDVGELTGKEGKIIYLSLDREAKDALALKHRYNLTEPGAVLTDEFGNLLKGGLSSSEQIADAYHEIDELMAETVGTWTEAIKKGQDLIKKEQYQEAARVLKIFAFASGTEKADKGKTLFDKIARIASKEFEAFAADAKTGELDEKARKALLAKLSQFIEKWPKTPAAISAEARMRELVPTRG